MSDLVAQSLLRLRTAGVRLDPGLSDTEVSQVEDRLNFLFGPEHRELVQAALQVGRSWPDWRSDSGDDLKARLDWPIDGIIFDVRHDAFWPSSWGERPTAPTDREREARTHLARVPRLVPLCSHRYLTADAQYAPSPVFSVYQTDVIFYGDDLLDYVAHEFRVPPLHPSSDRTYVAFWSELAEDADDSDL